MKKEDFIESLYKFPVLNMCCMGCNNCEIRKEGRIIYRCKLHNIRINDAMENVCFNYCPLNYEA